MSFGRHSGKNFAFEKARVLVCLLCLMPLWTMFGLPSKLASKNLCTDICVCVRACTCAESMLHLLLTLLSLVMHTALVRVTFSKSSGI